MESPDTELEWLAREVRAAERLSDADRIRIFRDLLRTADAIRAMKTPEEIRREEEARRILEIEPGRANDLAWVERMTVT